MSRALMLFAAAYFGGWILSSPSDSHAFYEVRVNASGCWIPSSAVSPVFMDDSGYGVCNQGPEGSNLEIYCSVPNTTSLQPQNMTAIWTMVYDGSTTHFVGVGAMTDYIGNSGGRTWGSAFSGSTASFTGSANAGFGNVYAGANAADFHYLSVLIPGGATKSCVRGFYFAG